MNQSGRKQRKHDMLKIKTFPRIHISLIGMNKDGYRINGGLGFSVSSPSLSLQFEPNDAIDILDERTNGFSGLELERLENHIKIIQARNELKQGLKCH